MGPSVRRGLQDYNLNIQTYLERQHAVGRGAGGGAGRGPEDTAARHFHPSFFIKGDAKLVGMEGGGSANQQ